jgi:Trypsin
MALTIALSSGVAQAIINGQPDTGPKAHPYVGALVTKVEGQLQNFCSGTLISPKVFLTAGHCTEAPKGAGLPKDLPTYVTFDPTFESGSSAVIKEPPTPTQNPVFRSPRLTIAARPRRDYLGSPLRSPAMM